MRKEDIEKRRKRVHRLITKLQYEDDRESKTQITQIFTDWCNSLKICVICVICVQSI